MVLSKVNIWNWWLFAVAFSGLMLDLGKEKERHSAQLRQSKLQLLFGDIVKRVHFAARASDAQPCTREPLGQGQARRHHLVLPAHHMYQRLCRGHLQEPAMPACVLTIQPSDLGLDTHMAISNCSIHFRFISSVLQKNWNPCLP